MTNDFDEKELISSALDGLTLALDSLHDLENISFEIECIIGNIENSYDELMRQYSS